jgi:hypothetical protein
VRIGSLVLDSNAVNQISPGIDLSVQLLSADELFRGVLIVINKEGVDLSSNLRPTSFDLKPQVQCPSSGYSGFTHTSESPKSSIEGTLFLGPSITAFLDVNIVIRNSQQFGSVYYYTRYQVSTVAQSPPTVPVTAPVSIPVQVPVNPPVPVPVPVNPPVPVPVPVNPPLPVPVPVPFSSPVATVPVPVPVPLFTPVSSPKAPVPVPVLSPMTTIPVPLPILVTAPVSAPVRVPMAAPIPVPAPMKLQSLRRHQQLFQLEPLQLQRLQPKNLVDYSVLVSSVLLPGNVASFADCLVSVDVKYGVYCMN